eukprot:TRINITY_DN148_c2_g1_i2.p1 TRINITY_DN148_c2_g1~~TRINITY_DN148_c2_g1_i2.p1  ORF type:complete len:566 (+),score=70.58 TRINITY_DN148_c2_g1_i2:255-1700(+)
MTETASEEVLSKCKEQLFQEIVRLYPLAELEDYYKNGEWKDDLMRTDIQLFTAHRGEAGADEPLPCDQVKLPELPNQKNESVKNESVKNEPVKNESVNTASGLPAIMPKPLSVLSAQASIMGDLKEIAVFVAKWRLDPQSAKTTLLPIPPAKRRYVMDNFAGPNSGADGITELTAYIKDCESNGTYKALTNASTNKVCAPAGNNFDMSEVAMFAMQWKLDPTKTKSVFQALAPEQRPYVINRFSTDLAGPEADAALTAFIEEAESSGILSTSEAATSAKTEEVEETPDAPAPAATPAKSARPVTSFVPPVTVPTHSMTSAVLPPKPAPMVTMAPRPVGRLTPPTALAGVLQLRAMTARPVGVQPVQPVGAVKRPHSAVDTGEGVLQPTTPNSLTSSNSQNNAMKRQAAATAAAVGTRAWRITPQSMMPGPPDMQNWNSHWGMGGGMGMNGMGMNGMGGMGCMGSMGGMGKGMGMGMMGPRY